jgi:hypothetical protein
MNNVPPDRERPDDADELYRRASARDTSQPSEAVRRAVVARATQLAAQHAPTASRRRVARLPSLVAYAWRRPAVFGSIAAAVVASLVIGPLWRELQPHTAPAALTANDLPVASVPPEEPQARLPVPPPSPADAPATAPKDLARERASVAQAQRAPRASPTRVAGNPAPVNAAPKEQADRAFQAGKAAPSALESEASRGGLLDSTRAPPPSAVSGGVNEVAVTAAPRSNAATAQDQTAVNPAQAFREAAERGDLTALEALRDKQTNIDARDAEGRSALMLAIEHGQSNAVSALLADGADPNAADSHGTTPLQAAMAGGQSAIIASLRSYGAR